MNQYFYLILKYQKGFAIPALDHPHKDNNNSSYRCIVGLCICTYNMKLWRSPAKIFRNAEAVVHAPFPSQSSDYEIGLLAAKTACSRCPLAPVQNTKHPQPSARQQSPLTSPATEGIHKVFLNTYTFLNHTPLSVSISTVTK